MNKANQKKRVFSGVAPSGNLTLGNYLGAITQWVPMQDEFDCIFCVVDYHAMTVKQDPELLRKRIIEIAKVYLASGINPQKAIIFQQSEVSEHVELAWILNTISRMSDLLRMTQFKDKAGLQDENLNLEKINKAGVGLFDYPVLMAADILLYDTDVVPVGEDQLQHVELTRDLGKRFNQEFGETFKIPEPRKLKEGARIMGLDDPTKKMSKSANSEYNYIALLDDPEVAAKKIMKATTDLEKEIKFDRENKPGISNLLVIYSLLANKSIKELEKEYIGKGYGDFKKDLAEVVKNFLIDFQKKYNSFSDQDVRKILDEGATKVKPMAEKTLKKVKEKVGII
jgi:tryptophanyl-tRNA synthetase